MKTVRLSQLARLQEGNQLASLVNIPRPKKARTEHSDNEAHSHNCRPRNRGEKSFTLKGQGLDLTVQSQVIQRQTHLAVTRSGHVPLTIT